MEAPDLHDLAVQLSKKVMYLSMTFLTLYDRFRAIDVLLNEFAKDLLSAYSRPTESVRKIDKQAYRLVKQGLYQVETLLRDIELLNMKGGHFHDEYLASKLAEVELILLEIKQDPSGLPRLFAKETVLGREYSNHKERLIEMLLDTNSSLVIPILGRPGTGKSTLGRLACIHPRVKEYFGHSIFYVNLTFVPNQDVVWRALQHESPGRGSSTCYPPELVPFMKALHIGGKAKKCLLLIDDLLDAETLDALLSINEKNPCFYDFLEAAESGTKIVITSSLQREHATALVSVPLQGLDDDESWNLFQSVAFQDQEIHDNDRLTVANKVCGKCGGNPSVVNIIASIMSTKQTLFEWNYFHDVVMTSVVDPITTVSSTLRLTELHCHHEFQQTQRQCFAWCSLLPTDNEFSKDYLLHLWRAQEVFDEVREVDLNSCFDEFQRSGYIIEGGSNNSVVWYKINYLVSELMKYVAGDDFYLDYNHKVQPNLKTIRHISFVIDDPIWMPPSWLLKAKQLQSLLLWPQTLGDFKLSTRIDVALSGIADLRTFHADKVLFERLPRFLARFKRLEHLKLGVSWIALPADIPPLHKLLDCDLQDTNGETLALRGSFRKLSVLYGNCNQMYSLQQTDEMVELLQERCTSSWKRHLTVESLEVCQWNEEILPTWAIDEFSTFIRGLRSIEIANCNRCRQVPGFNTLPNLNTLRLLRLDSLVDIAISVDTSRPYSKHIFYPSLTCLVLCNLPKFIGWSSEEADDNHNIHELYSLPLLTKVGIESCPKLISVPIMPMLESVTTVNIDSKMVNHLLRSPLSIQLTKTSEQDVSVIKDLEIDGCKDFDIEQGIWRTLGCVRSLNLSNIPILVSLPRGLDCIETLEELSLCWLTNLKVLPDWFGVFTQLQRLTIQYCPKLTTLPDSGGSFTVLEQLEIQYCPRLSRFPESFPNLKRLKVQEFGRLKQILRVSPHLEELEINNCKELDLIEHEAVWENVGRLRYLKLTKLESLPKGLDFTTLSELRQLIIQKCPKLTVVPESLWRLSTVEQLRLLFCPNLKKPSSSIFNLPSLRDLEIRGCPQLLELLQVWLCGSY